MDVHTAEVHAAVQQLVVERGECAPLELLLATDRLGYEDYRAWRECRRETLDDVLTDGGAKPAHGWRLRDRVKAIESWFALCRLAPGALERLIEAADFPDWALRSAWRVAAEQDPVCAMTPEWFPVWMLIEEPGLAAGLVPRHRDDAPSRAFDAVMALPAHPGPDERAVELRRSLRDIAPALLERFPAKRARAPAPATVFG